MSVRQACRLQSLSMQTLRRFRALASFMLVWFAMSIGVATASPFVHPQSAQLVCSASGDIKLLALGDDGTQTQRGHTLDCPLCVHFGSAAPPPAPIRLPQALRLAHALLPIPAAHIAARTAAPLPARGPPLFS